MDVASELESKYGGRYQETHKKLAEVQAVN